MRLALVKGSGHGPLVPLVGEPASLISCMAVSTLLLMLTSPEALGPGPLPSRKEAVFPSLRTWLYLLAPAPPLTPASLFPQPTPYLGSGFKTSLLPSSGPSRAPSALDADTVKDASSHCALTSHSLPSRGTSWLLGSPLECPCPLLDPLGLYLLESPGKLSELTFLNPQDDGSLPLPAPPPVLPVLATSSRTHI